MYKRINESDPRGWYEFEDDGEDLMKAIGSDSLDTYDQGVDIVRALAQNSCEYFLTKF